MIEIKAIIQAIGFPKQYLIKVLSNYNEKIKTKYNVKNSEIKNITLVKENLYEGFLEVDLEVNSLKSLLEFIMEFGPITIEVKNIKKEKLNEKILEDSLNYLIYKLMDLVNLNRALSAMYLNCRKKISFIKSLKINF